MSEAADLYETDFALWAETQARVLRDASAAGANLPVDWENVAEEIESLARTDRRTLRSKIETVLEHLLKLQFSPAAEPRLQWRDTIRRSRRDIDRVASESPSLRRELPDMVVDSRVRGTADAVDSLNDHGEAVAAVAAKVHGANYEPAQVLDHDFFPEPPSRI